MGSFIAGYTDGGFPYGITWEEYGFADMVDFAETIEDKKLQSTLMHILSGGRKIFRRFKDELSSDKEQLERYYLFIEERNQQTCC
ncbi:MULTISPECIES: hypothetical protein [unclassified Paenibacillus]|uniref:hypothetical protein n=1 Tax=unclassified Paenibacillus TaxID=185978 RepID=UPI001E286CCD|nr:MULTISPECIES: hypothetical protein [unclassified Paenibacillus]CAH0119011.1 hypothetical protein PAE9249_01508 [Paenibacillus sp. CECT 9249]